MNLDFWQRQFHELKGQFCSVTTILRMNLILESDSMAQSHFPSIFISPAIFMLVGLNICKGMLDKIKKNTYIINWAQSALHFIPALKWKRYSTITVKSDRADRGLLKIYYLYSFTCIKYVNAFPILLLCQPETEGDSTGEHLLCQDSAELLHFLIPKKSRFHYFMQRWILLNVCIVFFFWKESTPF